MNIKKIGLSTSAFGFAMGSTGKNTERRNLKPWTIEEFVDFAHSKGFGGVEAPLMRFVPDLSLNRLDELKSKLDKLNMFFLLDAETALNLEQVRTLMPLAKKFKSSIIRVKTSDVLGCARKKLGRPWFEHIDYCINMLKEIAPELRKDGIRVAIENHQDVDSNDLLRIIGAVGPDSVGVNYDIGNAFSVCEDPVSFARKIAPYILNIHLKDYKIYESENGFRLVRCPVGEGSVDFKAVLELLAKSSSSATMAAELGALEARNISWLESNFWDEIEPRTDGERHAFSELIQKLVIKTKDESWKTKWEKGALPEAIVSSEVADLEASLDYLKEL